MKLLLPRRNGLVDSEHESCRELWEHLGVLRYIHRVGRQLGGHAVQPPPPGLRRTGFPELFPVGF